jgi:REP element-mobilizing transposase RayT
VFEKDNLSPLIFLTVCMKDRKKILANHAAHQLLLNAWARADQWRVGRYVLMPDHLHLFCSPARHPAMPLRAWMQYWKTLVSRSWPQPDQHPIWQQDAWDTQLRSGEGYSEKWEYVRANPVRAGLVADPDAWPYQGEMNVLHWHDR